MAMIEKLTHFDPEGRAGMVDVTAKTDTARTAVAKGRIRVSPPVLRAILEGTAKKGDVLGVARVAGIMAVKRTSELIPLCHPLMLGSCSLDFHVDEKACEVEAVCTASLTGQTGVEKMCIRDRLVGVSMENVGQNTVLHVPTRLPRRRMASMSAVTVPVLPDLRIPTTVMIFIAGLLSRRRPHGRPDKRKMDGKIKEEGERKSMERDG